VLETRGQRERNPVLGRSYATPNDFLKLAFRKILPDGGNFQDEIYAASWQNQVVVVVVLRIVLLGDIHTCGISSFSLRVLFKNTTFHCDFG